MSRKRNSSDARAARRASARSAKNGSPQVHPTRSFQQLVGHANKEALKPYIDQQVVMAESRLARTLIERHLQPVHEWVGAFERVLEKVLNVEPSVLENAVADVQDERTGFTLSDSAAEEGDRVRATIATKAKKDEDFNDPQKIMVDNLARAPFLVNEKFEKALLGVTPGEVKEIPFGEGDSEVIAKVTVERVSTPVNKPKKEVFAKTEGAQATQE